MNLPCPVHPDRAAHRGCHFCRRPICRLCELRMRGHLYCSTRCARDAGRHVAWKRIRAGLLRPVPARLAVVAIALGAASPMLLALRAVAELDRLSGSPFRSEAPPRPSARIDRVVERDGAFAVEGSAPAGAAVFLFSPSGLVGAAAVAEGRFRFDGVRKPGPFRVGALPVSAASKWIAPGPAVAAAKEDGISTAGPDRPGPPAPPAAAAASSPVAEVAPDFTRGPADRRELVVSFDGGSSSRGAGEILDALAARGVRTTIFLTGEFIRRHPDLVRRIAADGHEVGNHTDTHPHLTTYARDGRQATASGVTESFLRAELARTAAAFRAATGRTLAPLWRAPYGEQNPEIRRWAAHAGYWHVGWTGGRAGLDGLDWVSDPRSRAYRSSEGVVERLVARAENGGIVLLHLGSDRSDPVAPRVAGLLDGLAARGFRFARASDVLGRAGLTPERLAAIAARARSDAR